MRVEEQLQSLLLHIVFQARGCGFAIVDRDGSLVTRCGSVYDTLIEHIASFARGSRARPWARGLYLTALDGAYLAVFSDRTRRHGLQGLIVETHRAEFRRALIALRAAST
jgi:hypothetical protein